MATIRVDDRLVREALRKAPVSIVAGIHRSLMRSSVFTQREFRKNIHVGATGAARRSVTIRFPNLITARVEPTAAHAEWLEKGTRPHWTSVKNLEKWANQKGINPYALQRGIAKHGTKAHPYLDKTYDRVEPFALHDMEHEVNKVIGEVI